MKVLITYYSETGNTQKIAEAITSIIGEESDLMQMEEVTSFKKYDFIFLGFPVHQFGMPKIVKEILKVIKDKKIACFITHAMPKDAALFDKQINNCKSLFTENELIDIFSCKGELSEKTALQMIHSENESMRSFGRMRNNTLNHPDEDDLDSAKQFAKMVIQSISLI